MKIVTLQVHPDEPCYSLAEGPRKIRTPEGAIENHWVQRVYVVRGDAIAEYTKDYGLAALFKEIPPLVLLSDGDDTVAQLQELAERHRHDDKWIKWRQELQAESTLISDIVRQREQKWELLHNRSQFGPGLSVQRNAVNLNPALRRDRDKRQAYTGIIAKKGK